MGAKGSSLFKAPDHENLGSRHPVPDRINIIFREHLEILTAIIERDESLAERRMKEHISNAFKDYIKVTLLDEAGIQDTPGRRANKNTGS